MQRHFLQFVLFLLLISFTATALGQGILVSEQHMRLPRPGIIIIEPPYPPYPPGPRPPRPPRPEPAPVLTYKISNIEVNAKLTDQIAEVLVSQSFVNTGNSQMEVSFVFPLPYEGAIDQLTLMVDGKELPGKLMAADKAREKYEEIVRKSKDPALLEWIGTGMFRTSVFPIPAGATRTVTLKYTQLCRNSNGMTDFLFPLSTAKYTAQAIEKIAFNVTIDSSSPIRNVYSPSQDVKIEKPTEKSAKVTWTAENTVPSTDFRLMFDVGTEKLTTRVLSYRQDTNDEGFFLLLANPEIKKTEEKPLPKNVIFVLDNSGSMMGNKMDQARDALKFVMNNLREGDSFNIVVFNTRLELFKDAPQTFNDTTRKEALAFAEGVYASGGTNIDGAMKLAFEQIAKMPEKQPTYVLFLTDGCPTVGECNEMKIAENARKNNTTKARVFAFGVGYDLNSRLLDKLVRDSSGQSEFVLPEENIEERVSRLYNKLEAPVMTNVQLVFEPADDSEAKKNNSPMVNRVYPANGFDIFAGEQLVISGRYKYPGKGTLKVTGSVGENNTQEFTYPVELVASSSDSRYAFAEKLWAVRRIGEIIDQLDLQGKNQEMLDELIQLSIKHGILTPYTSFLADEGTDLHDQTANITRVERRTMALEKNVAGSAGVHQRKLKSSFQNAQRFAMDADEGAMNAVMAEEAAPAPAFQADSSMPTRNARTGGRRARMAAPAVMAAHGMKMAAPAPMPSGTAQASQEKQNMNQNVRNIQNRTFFFKENQWVDSSLTEEQQKAKPQKIRQFSDEYFALIKANADIAPFMTFDEAVLLNVNGKPVLIEP